MARTGDERAITVYFDGECPVCRDQVDRYWKLARRGTIVWRDLTWPGDPLRDEPFTLAAALETLHAKDADGRLHVGLDAHLLMWERLPRWRLLAAALRRFPPLRQPAEAAYRAFLRRRPGRAQRRAHDGADRG